MPDLSIMRHTAPSEGLEAADELAAEVADTFDQVPAVGDRIFDRFEPTGGPKEWRVYERGFYPRLGSVTLTLCPYDCDPAYFRRECNQIQSADA